MSSASSPHNAPTPSTTHEITGSSMRKKKPCRFFASQSGCRAGGNCPFIHVNDDTLSSGHSASQNATKGESSQAKPILAQSVPNVLESMVVAKPVLSRESELNQIRRRFAPKESQLNHGTTALHLQVRPTDPDFPFELPFLSCILNVPSSYPDASPVLKVKNSEIPAGVAINIERGWDKLVSERRGATLLNLVNALDKNLEHFLAMEEAKTVKLVANADRRHLSNAHIGVTTEISSPTPKPISKANPPPKSPLYTESEKSNAQSQRAQQVRQLESRLGRHALFRRSSDGIAFTLPLDPRFRDRLPFTLRTISTVTLYVPLLYPLEPCRVKLMGVPAEESNAPEIRFVDRVRESRGTTLMAHLNFLAQNLHTMALPLPEEEKLPRIEDNQPASPVNQHKPSSDPTTTTDVDRSHIVHIPRPPEWDLIDPSDFSEDSDFDSISSEDIDDPAGLETGGGKLVDHSESSGAAHNTNRERGTAISFPFLELFGIELLEISILNLTIKCERCKEPMEVSGLKDGITKNFECKKCCIPLAVTFRKELMHANSARAGFLDLEGCTIVDMMPCTFVPTCSQCSTTWSAGIVSVWGETTTNVCRESGCHQKNTFKIHEFKTLRISASNRVPPAVGPRRKKEVLGLVAGENLPAKGKCKHYAKSYRWFRFSCCQKTYPCDRCHDEAEEHPNEHANRMICGFCSREQNYRPEDCSLCRSVLVGKNGGGFWEGGKGTRDKVRMSRKDPRKYKRIGGGAT